MVVVRIAMKTADKPIGILGLVNASLEDRTQLRREIDFHETVQRQLISNPAHCVLPANIWTEH